MLPLVYHSIYSQLELSPNHRYPINKYRLLRMELEKQAEQDPTWDELFKYFEPKPVSVDEVKRVHASEYVDALINGDLPAAKMRRIGFPWSQALIDRTLMSAGGTRLTAEKALEHGLAIHLSGGYHHAHYDFGSGFCLFHDLVIAADWALQQEGVDRVLIIDSDVHHGDGTAALCAHRDDIITLSFHCDKNFPARKPDSNIDIGLPKMAGDEVFLSHFMSVVPMAINLYQPDLIIYDAGIDIHEDDELGHLAVTTAAIYQRDYFMLEVAKEKEIPMACVVGGGYRDQHESLVPIHMQLFKAAHEHARQNKAKG